MVIAVITALAFAAILAGVHTLNDLAVTLARA